MQQRADEMNSEEAQVYLGVNEAELRRLATQFGVARFYEARMGDPFVYERADLDKIKLGLKEKNGSTS
jgi:hypothetical protein